jgi:hypothetical protein
LIHTDSSPTSPTLTRTPVGAGASWVPCAAVPSPSWVRAPATWTCTRAIRVGSYQKIKHSIQKITHGLGLLTSPTPTRAWASAPCAAPLSSALVPATATSCVAINVVRILNYSTTRILKYTNTQHSPRAQCKNGNLKDHCCSDSRQFKCQSAYWILDTRHSINIQHHHYNHHPPTH